jgi:photosystem II stability/assembly factor-like uncharacterized protein
MKTLKIILITLALAITGLGIYWMPVTKQAPQEARESASGLYGKIMGRFDQEFQMTVDPELNVVPRERLLKAIKVAQDRRADMALRSGVVPLYWDERGPSNVGGRTRSVLIDANDPTGRTIWAGSVSGGLWLSTNIDAEDPAWTPVNDLFQNLSISSIVQDPNNSNILYFGTGEGWGNIDAVRGLGVWTSTDGGSNWTQMSPINPAGSPNVNKLLFDANGNLLAATTNGLRRYDPINDTWPFILGNGLFANSNFITDIELAANGDLYAATFADGIYRSTNNGNVWNPVNTGLPAANFGRIELACAPGNAAIVYAILADTTSANSGNCLSVHRTTNNGGNWVSRSCPGNFGGQAWYDLILAVDPNDSNRLWAGGVGISVSPDGGTSWTPLGGIHPDHHAIVYYPGDSDQILFGNDGGVYKSYDGSVAMPSFTDKNTGYNVTQFYAVGLHPDAGSNYMLGGTQDNATPKFQNAGVNATTCVLCCCDGGWAFIDEDDPSIQIASTQNGSFSLSTDGGGSFGNNIVPGDNNRLFITPAEYDDAANVFYHSDTPGRLGRVVDIGGANTASSDSLPALGGRTITTLIKSPSVANRLYVGTTNGNLFQIDNAHLNGGTTVNPLNGPGGGWMSSIAVDQNDENHILLTMSNYGVISVWETPDAGLTWNAVEGDLPDIPVRWAIFHPFDSDQAILATELGVWTTDDLDNGDTEWYPTNAFGFANVRVDMIQYRSSDNLVVLATHGRGMYTTDYFNLLESCVPSQTIGGNVAAGLYMAEDFIESDGTILAERSVVYQAGNQITLQEDFHARRGSFFVAAIQECGMSPAPSPIVEEDEEENGAFAANSPSNPFAVPEMKCFPNPASFQMSVQVELPKEQWYQLEVKDLTGHTLATLANGSIQPAGANTYELNAEQFPPGYYLLVLQTREGALTERFVVAR